MRAAFVVGIARSGTSLLVSLLDGHPQVAVQPQESKVFEWCGADDPVATLFEATRYGDLFAEGSAERARFEAALRAGLSGPVDFGTALEALNAALAELRPQPGARVWLEKTPKHLRSLPLLLERFGPDTRFVVCVRDPRAVFSSQSGRWRRSGARDARHFCRRWATGMELLRSFRDAHPETLLAVRYEDVVADPPSWLQRIADHLGVDYDEAMLKPTQLGREWEGNSSFGSTRGIGTDAVDRWLSRLDREEIEAVEQLAARWMREWGYEARFSGAASLLSPYRLRMELSLRYNLLQERRRWSAIRRELPQAAG